MTVELLAFGGRNHANPQSRPAWGRYEVAVLLKIRDGVVVDRLEYRGTALDKEVGVSVNFKAATIADGFAWTCTSTEILKIDLATFKIVQTFSHRWFNDLHHVTWIGDRCFVASTGLDSVLEFDANLELVKRHPQTDDEVIARHGGLDVDFRRIPTTKPHNAHSNFVWQWEDAIWVTNHEAGRVETLSGDRRHHVADQRIHDGIPELGRIWFTAVNGVVVRMKPQDGTIESFDLTPMTATDRKLGWCRGIAVLGDNDVLVGFSKLRATKLRENLKWLGNKLLNQDFALAEATRIARYDLVKRTETWRLELDQHGMDAVYSLHAG